MAAVKEEEEEEADWDWEELTSADRGRGKGCGCWPPRLPGGPEGEARTTAGRRRQPGPTIERLPWPPSPPRADERGPLLSAGLGAGAMAVAGVGVAQQMSIVSVGS